METFETNKKYSFKACDRHKPKELVYLQWFEWAEMKTRRGAKQRQCPKCGRWYFKEEY